MDSSLTELRNAILVCTVENARTRVVNRNPTVAVNVTGVARKIQSPAGQDEANVIYVHLAIMSYVAFRLQIDKIGRAVIRSAAT